MGTFTMATGFGMLGMGLVVILIGGLVILKVINAVEQKKQTDKQMKEMEKRTWI